MIQSLENPPMHKANKPAFVPPQPRKNPGGPRNCL